MTSFDITNCRICLSSNNIVPTAHWSTVMNSTYEELLNYVLPEILWKPDRFPSNICAKCIQDLIICTNFKLFSLKSHMARRKYIDECQNRNDEEDDGNHNQGNDGNNVLLSTVRTNENTDEIRSEIEAVEKKRTKVKKLMVMLKGMLTTKSKVKNRRFLKESTHSLTSKSIGHLL